MAVEVLSHIHQTCPVTHDIIVRRHDNMINKVASFLEIRSVNNLGFQLMKVYANQNWYVQFWMARCLQMAELSIRMVPHKNKVEYYDKAEFSRLDN